MPLSELLPTVSQLSHQDKLGLIHFILVTVTKKEGCSLEYSKDSQWFEFTVPNFRQNSFSVD
jgi:hypothetical protein